MSSCECGSGSDPEGPSVGGSRGPRDLPHVLPLGKAAGVDGGYQGFEIGPPGQLGVQAL